MLPFVRDLKIPSSQVHGYRANCACNEKDLHMIRGLLFLKGCAKNFQSRTLQKETSLQKKTSFVDRQAEFPGHNHGVVEQ